MGCPFSLAGLNCHCFTASNAASRKTGRPLRNCRLVTLPSLPTVPCTVTVPLRRRTLAIAGYTGATRLRTWTGSSSDWEIIDGVDEATGLVSELSAPGTLPALRFNTGAASGVCAVLSVLAIFDVPAETATASGVRFSCGGGGGSGFLAEFLSAFLPALASAALASAAGLAGTLGAETAFTRFAAAGPYG